MKNRQNRRRGNVLVLVAAFMLGLMVVVAFAVDYGYLLVMRTDLQRAADAAALAAVRELEPDGIGAQTGAEAAARATARQYANLNLRETQPALTIPDGDIEIGRYDRSTINSGTVTINPAGANLMDTVRVTLRRDGVTNPAIGLFFGRVVGVGQANMQVSATAVLRAARVLEPGDAVLPIAVDLNEWMGMDGGDELSIYGDGHVVNQYGDTVPGNWGTVDIGNVNNSTQEMNDQIENGLRQEDLDFLYNDYGPDGERRIPTNTEVPPDTWVQGETGLSGGLQGSLNDTVGQVRMVPIVDQMAGGAGNTTEYHIICWGVVSVSSVNLQGANSMKHVTIAKSYTYDGTLKPNPDLSALDTIDGAFTAAGLVE